VIAQAGVFDAWRTSAVALDVMTAGRGQSRDIAARQAARLARLLESAAKGSRLYQRKLRGKNLRAAVLAELPVVTKAELMHHFADWVTDPQLELGALQGFTADARRIGEPYLDRFVVWESSGTSGEPGIFVQDAQAMAVYDALEALRRSPPRLWQRWLDPMYATERMAFIGATTGHFASQVSVHRLRRLNPWLAQSLRSFSILQPVAELVAELNLFAPTIIATYPTAAALLAEQARQGALNIAPQEIWTGGETLSAAVRDCVQQVFGCSMRNSYGASEFLTIGWECDQGRMHANSDWVILEPVDEHHRPVPPGQPSCSTLLTNLANQVQPLIRYDLGDQTTLSQEPCACGSPLPTIDVQGRRDDALVMAGRDGRPVTLLPLALTTVLEDEAGVFDFQLQQRGAHTLALRLGLTGAAAQQAQQRCGTALRAFAQRHGLAPLEIVADAAPPQRQGRGGKVRRIVAMQATQR